MRRVVVPSEASPVPCVRWTDVACIHTLDGETMGTSWAVKLVAPRQAVLAQLRRAIQLQLDKVVAQMSTWERRSDLCLFNRAAAESWQTLPAEFFEVLSCALSIAEDSGGAYDPCVGALVDLWGFGPACRRNTPPPDEAIGAARLRGGWTRTKLDRIGRRAWQAGSVHLDLSSIAKGFGVDLVADYLDRIGVRSYLVEVGGELRGFGVKPDGNPWWVALERPPAVMTAAAIETIVALHGLAIATSGDYRRYFDDGGRRYSHTIDPRTGYPVTNGLVSVTVLHRRCMQADALATALFVLGLEGGMDYARRRDLAAIFIRRAGDDVEETMSPAFAALLE